MRVLLVEDEPYLAQSLQAAFRKQDILLDHVDNLADAREAIMQNLHDAVLLDRRLPDGEGLSLMPLVRSELAQAPVIVLSAMGESPQRIEGLDSGADDYISKPYSVDEVLARLRAVLRRGNVIKPDTINLGRLSYRPEEQQAFVDGVALDLPRREVLVLEALMRRAGRTTTRRALEEAVYDFDDEIASNTLDAHISRLRKRLTQAEAGVEIHTVRGIGYIVRSTA